MGIPGLASYVENYSYDFLRDYKLHNQPLVIDGSSTFFQLYIASKCDYMYGGNYSKYADIVNRFFTNLLECGVVPIIIFDGGWEDKKICTLYNRLKEHIQRIYNQELLAKSIIPPIFAKDVFKFVARQKGAHFIQTIFEADDHIAGLAKNLGCPVLSNDSDFYFYGADYITFNASDLLNPQTLGDGYIRCKIFRTEHWLNRFPRLEIRNLPLIAALLGNDEIDPIIFENFFKTLKVPSSIIRNHRNISHRIIAAISHWLQGRSIDSAVIEILSKVRPENHRLVKEKIENVMNSYAVLPNNIDEILQLLPEEIASTRQRTADIVPYRFRHLQCGPNLASEYLGGDYVYLNACPRVRNAISSEGSTRISAPIINNDPLPVWFRDKYAKALLPSEFINMLFRQTTKFDVCVEDISLPLPSKTCFKIIGIIHEILSNRSRNHRELRYISRGEGAQCFDVRINTVPSPNCILPCEIPALEDLDNLDSSMKKQIFMATLDIDDNLNNFPNQWRLYIATIKYWKSESNLVTENHIYALVISMIFNIVQKYISPNEEVFGKLSLEECIRNANSVHEKQILNSIKDLNLNQCLTAESNFEIKAQIINYMGFDRIVIHVFTLFQTCLKNIKYLNALLNSPLNVDANLPEFFNGVLIYNIYCGLTATRGGPEEYVRDFFRQCPSVLKLFSLVMTEI
ncbi:hypothetical protein QAD02_011231 [Eretmocerus hayati]|uniref:Uncharacterized protein n=1 Tax=Eretmocerus hayati TaxID=131215 RepID=A0ACC2NVX5_9HYME|nr:hypothetical protein QAD02_011231 [Eretmocerus hayati]